MQNEMCNMYMMVTSEIPYFMSCGNRRVLQQLCPSNEV